MKEFEKKAKREHLEMISFVASTLILFIGILFVVLAMLNEQFGDHLWSPLAAGCITMALFGLYYKLIVSK